MNSYRHAILSCWWLKNDFSQQDGLSQAIESIETTFMEKVSTWVLDKDKKHYLRCKAKAEKSYDVSKHTIAYVKIQNN